MELFLEGERVDRSCHVSTLTDYTCHLSGFPSPAGPFAQVGSSNTNHWPNIQQAAGDVSRLVLHVGLASRTGPGRLRQAIRPHRTQ
jgi:hypothetical protein